MEAGLNVPPGHPLQLLPSLHQQVALGHLHPHFLASQEPGVHAVEAGGCVRGQQSEIPMEAGDHVPHLVLGEVASGRGDVVRPVDESLSNGVLLEAQGDGRHLADGDVGLEELLAPALHDFGEVREVGGDEVAVGPEKPVVSPSGIDLGVHGRDGEVLVLELDLLLDVGVLQLMVVFLETDLDLVQADVEVPVALLELPAPYREVVLQRLLQPRALGEVMPGILGVDETAAMEHLDNILAILLPAALLVEIPREVHRQPRGSTTEGRHRSPDDSRKHNVQ